MVIKFDSRSVTRMRFIKEQVEFPSLLEDIVILLRAQDRKNKRFMDARKDFEEQVQKDPYLSQAMFYPEGEFQKGLVYATPSEILSGEWVDDLDTFIALYAKRTGIPDKKIGEHIDMFVFGGDGFVVQHENPEKQTGRKIMKPYQNGIRARNLLSSRWGVVPCRFKISMPAYVLKEYERVSRLGEDAVKELVQNPNGMLRSLEIQPNGSFTYRIDDARKQPDTCWDISLKDYKKGKR